MKISVYNEPGGTMAVLVQAAPGKGMPPVVHRGLTKEKLSEVVSAEVARVRAGKPPRPEK